MDEGYHESGESWANLLRDAARRGMRAPVLAVGDGALGFRKALRGVFPATREQRCWVHKTANMLDSLPKSAQPASRENGIDGITRRKRRNLTRPDDGTAAVPDLLQRQFTAPSLD